MEIGLSPPPLWGPAPIPADSLGPGVPATSSSLTPFMAAGQIASAWGVGVGIKGLFTPWWSDGKASAYNAGDTGSISGQEDPLEKEMATHSSILVRKIP